MPLFIDGNISSLDDLRTYDSSILDLASVEGVELQSKLALAEREIGVEIQAFLARQLMAEDGEVDPSSLDLGKLVATEPLRQWHCLRSLAIIYRDVYYSQLNDRYLGRWKEFSRLDQNAAALLFETGLGMVHDPIRQAEAPLVTIEPGFAEPGSFYIRVSWLNARGQEGRPSQPIAVLPMEPHTLRVQAVNPPANAVAWNVYVGGTEPEISRQNGDPLALGSTWEMPATGLVRGPRPAEGQSPDYLLRHGYGIRRG
ncbi:MAG: hypothetical protein IRZ15_09455 [Bryobacteraceae bacterium]|nr:hypothetical protein [Bryobacteraceae bacterium]